MNNKKPSNLSGKKREKTELIKKCQKIKNSGLFSTLVSVVNRRLATLTFFDLGELAIGPDGRPSQG